MTRTPRWAISSPAGAYRGEFMHRQTRAQAQLRLVGDLYARAMDLGGGNQDPELAVLELVSLSGGDPVALELARGHCLALLDLDPDDPRAGRALELLTLASHPS
jgi:hypothetical protein